MSRDDLEALVAKWRADYLPTGRDEYGYEYADGYQFGMSKAADDLAALLADCPIIA